jgi:multimeric flavodoxin WrbA
MKSAYIVVGSPRKEGSSSNAIASYLLARLTASGWSVEKGMVGEIVRDETTTASALEQMDKVDLVVLSFPLYVDSLPAPLIKFLEASHDHRKGTDYHGQKLLAICQCGFPESKQTDLALEICATFAKDAHYDFAGGLAIGGGGAIGSMDIATSGMLRKLKQALDMTADAAASGNDMPAAAKDLVGKGLVPRWLYLPIINKRWKRSAKENGVDINAKPHA